MVFLVGAGVYTLDRMDRLLRLLNLQLARMSPEGRAAAAKSFRDLVDAARRFFSDGGIKLGLGDGLHAIGLISQNMASGRGTADLFVRAKARAPELELKHVSEFLSAVPSEKQ